MAPVLLSRALDPLLGIFTGAFAYYLYEAHPRSGISQEDRLTELCKWKLSKWRSERERRLTGSGDDETVLDVVRLEVEKE